VATTDPTAFVHPAGRISHADHRAAGAAAIDAVYPAAENAMAFPHLVTSEGLEPHHVSRLYLMWTPEARDLVDISDTLDLKLAALREHASQLRDPERTESFVRAWVAEAGEAVGVAAAEAFTVYDFG
jgi:LmbE family N-acetylglucosaminyl deacetylase